MTPAAHHSHDAAEDSRLEALRRYAVLDTPPEGAFDRIVETTAFIFDVPTAVISFIDKDRQWIKAHVGTVEQDADLDGSLCAHVVEQKERLIVEDAASDSQFNDHPLVTGPPGLRFYAGAPLITPDGHALGTLAVIDTVPHTPSEEVLTQFENMAAMVIDELELRRAATNQRLQLALEAANAGTFVYDVETGQTDWDQRTCSIYGLPEGHEPAPNTSLVGIAHPEDTVTVQDEFAEAIHNGSRYEIDYRIIRPDGEIRHVHSAGVVERDHHGDAQRVIGINQDVTERKRQHVHLQQSRERWRRLVEAHRDPIQISVNGSIVYMNPAGVDLFGAESPDAMIGRSVFDLSGSDTVTNELKQRLAQLARGEPTDPYEHEIVREDGERRVVVAYSVPIRYNGQVAAQTVLRDVSERKARERALRESEARFRTMFETNSAPMLLIDAETGGIVDANEAAVAFYGYEAEHLSAMTIDQINMLPPEKVAAHRAAARSGSENRFVFRHRLQSGDVRTVEVYSTPITVQGSTLLFSIIHDITERTRAEERLRRQEQQYRELVQTTSAILWRGDPETFEFTFVSKEAEHLLGYPRERWVNEPNFWEAHIHPDDRRWAPDYCQQATEDQRRHTFDYRMVAADGRTVWLRDIVNVIVEDGRPVELVGVMIDITDQKGTERALSEREERVKALYDAVSTLTHAQTPLELAERVRTLVTDTLGYPVCTVRYARGGALVPVVVSDVAHLIVPLPRPVRSIAGDSPAAKAYRRGATVHVEEADQAAHACDAEAVRAAAYVPVGDVGTISVGSLETNGIDPFDVYLLDILAHNAAGVIQRMEREDVLRAARDEAQEASRLKSAFLANMSHEIRTPLTSILGFAEMLADMDLGETPGHFADVIHGSGQRLLDTLNSVLDLSKLEAGMMNLTCEPVDVQDLAASVAVSFEAHAASENVALTTDLAPSVMLHTDAAAFQRVLTNLVSNAIKFTPSGGRVTVTLSCTAETVTLSVADTGIGIDDNFLPHVFDAFRQESSGNARQFEGSGLGLAITARLVDLMDGTIDVESAKGEGTTFTVAWPREAEQEAA